MKLEIKKLEDNKIQLNIEAASEAVKTKFDDVFQKIGKEAKVAGFRPGNAPRDIIEKNYSSAAHEQVLKELIPELYDEAIKKEALDAIDYPQISEVKLDRLSLSFKAIVEVSPEIKVKDYKGIKVSFKKIEAGADDLKRNLDAIKESRKLETIDDNFARGAGYPDLSEFEEAVKRQIFLQKENQQRQNIENHIIESITKGLDFKVPRSLLKRQVDDMLRHAQVDLAMKGVPREKIEEQEKEMVKTLEPAAEKQVRIYLVLAEIAKRENIALDDHMPRNVIEFLLKEADWEMEDKNA